MQYTSPCLTFPLTFIFLPSLFKFNWFPNLIQQMQTCVFENMKCWAWYSPEIIHHGIIDGLKTCLILSPVSRQIIKNGGALVRLKQTILPPFPVGQIAQVALDTTVLPRSVLKIFMAFLGNKFSPFSVIYGQQIQERFLPSDLKFVSTIISIKLKRNCFEIDHLNSQNIFNPNLIYI